MDAWPGDVAQVSRPKPKRRERILAGSARSTGARASLRRRRDTSAATGAARRLEEVMGALTDGVTLETRGMLPACGWDVFTRSHRGRGAARCGQDASVSRPGRDIDRKRPGRIASARVANQPGAGDTGRHRKRRRQPTVTDEVATSGHWACCYGAAGVYEMLAVRWKRPGDGDRLPTAIASDGWAATGRNPNVGDPTSRPRWRTRARSATVCDELRSGRC